MFLPLVRIGVASCHPSYKTQALTMTKSPRELALACVLEHI